MHDFDERFRKATSRISTQYFQLPVARLETPIYRERVYCYELYHQLRQDWPDCGYLLSGETDKSGHPVIRKGYVARSKPDFLIHIPEDMENNFAAIEVKPIGGAYSGVRKDIRTLLAFLDDAHYRRGLYLIYGSTEEGRALNFAKDQIAVQGLQSRIELWHHAIAGKAAERVLFDSE